MRLFGDEALPADAPLAARMRPRTLEEYLGQPAVLGERSPVRALLDGRARPSLLLWGPPGTGKTTLALLIARHLDAEWRQLSAVTAGVKDVRAAIEEAATRQAAGGPPTLLFIDEIHRFNKAQQDALLPAVESGVVTLIGATTENPFFEVNAPLLSRCELVRLQALPDDAVAALLDRAVADPDRGFAGRVTLTEEAREHLVHVADGDARAALGALEVAVAAAGAGASPQGRDGEVVTVDLDATTEAAHRYRYDKTADGHYDQASAFIKSMRGSDPDAAVYWLLRMLESGEDPRFLARRMVIFASEDVGMADRQALPLAVAAFEALDRVGLPEARYALVHAAITLATAPKSDSVKRALGAGLDAVKRTGNAPVPAHLRDAHYRGARRLGHGVGYDYPHEHPDAYVPQQYLPDELVGRQLYEPTSHGHEGPVAERLAALRDRARPTDTTT